MRLKKKVKIILGLITIILVAAIVVGVIWTRKPEETPQPEKKDCTPFTGGAYTLYFNTNGGSEIKSMHICIACSPDSYEEIPTPTKEGDTFEGWYYDKAFKKKVTQKSTADIIPVDEIDKDGCKVGYKDITLYAKWTTSKPEETPKEEKSTKKTTTKKQNTSYYCEDGSKLSNGNCIKTETINATVDYTCGGLEEYGERCIEKSLPAVNAVCRAGLTYNVVDGGCVGETSEPQETCEANGGNYYDNICYYYEQPTQYICDGERAGMELVGETCFTFSSKTPVYSCPGDYKLEGSKCTKTITTPAKKR